MKLWTTVCLAVVGIAWTALGATVVPPAPAGMDAFNGYAVKADGQDVPVVAARVSKFPLNCVWPGHQRPLWQTELAGWCRVTADGPVAFEVESARDFAEALVRPLGRKVAVAREGRRLSFTLPGPGYYTLELDGFHGALMVFVERPHAYAPRPGNRVRRLGPGVHRLGRIELGSGETLVLEDGAVLKGSVFAFGARNVEVIGGGVIDGSEIPREAKRGFGAIDNSLGSGGGNAVPMLDGAQAPFDRAGFDRLLDETACLDGNVRFYRCTGVRVAGPVMNDSPLWSCALANCEDVVFEGVKEVGMWRYNADGVDFVNCRRVTVRDCFFRNFDDCIVIKGIPGFDAWSNEDYLVERCVTWCDWGRPLEIGAETVAPEYRNLVFRDCDLIHGSTVNLDIQHHNGADIHDVLFENIRVEYTRHQLSDVYDDGTRTEFPDPWPVRHPLLVEIPIHDFWHFTKDPRHGSVHDVVFRKIQVLRDDPSVPAPVCAFKGLNDASRVRNVRLENFTLDGRPFAPEVRTNGFAEVSSETDAEKGRPLVGIFYFLWLGEDHRDPPHDISKILRSDPKAGYRPDDPVWGRTIGYMHHWGEPLYGYYCSDDEWVVRRHMKLLMQAKVDFLFFDVTNTLIYEKNAKLVMRVLQEYRDAGWSDVPQVMFYTNTKSGETVQRLYERIYRPGFAKDTWFRLDGRPVVVAHEGECSAEAREFFTIVKSQWPNEAAKAGGWPWMDFTRPQRLFPGEKVAKSVMNVSVAQHPQLRFGDSALYGEKGNCGRAYHDGANDPDPEAWKRGGNFIEQWDRALEAKPDIVLVTGWNEWIAGRWEGTKERPLMFVDCANWEYSRDIEMMRGGYGDAYFRLLCDYVRRFKGLADDDGANPPGTARRYRCFADAGFSREAQGYGTNYVNRTQRNVPEWIDVSHDATSVTFAVKTRLPVAGRPGEGDFMRILVDGHAVNERGRCVIGGDRMTLVVPRAALPGAAFGFKFVDSTEPCREPLDYYDHGVVAPLGYAEFRYSCGGAANRK